MDMENTILKQIQQNLDALQKQIDNMKPNPPETEIEIPEMQTGLLRGQLKEKSDELMQIMKDMINASESGVCMSAVFSITGSEHGNLNQMSFYFADSVSEIEKIDETKLAGTVEAFSSPKRITIIKVFMSKKFLSSNELTMKTGCIGGQLYHHLSILENARIICKSNEAYTLTDYGRNIANQIFGIILGEPSL